MQSYVASCLLPGIHRESAALQVTHDILHMKVAADYKGVSIDFASTYIARKIADKYLTGTKVQLQVIGSSPHQGCAILGSSDRHAYCSRTPRPGCKGYTGRADLNVLKTVKQRMLKVPLQMRANGMQAHLWPIAMLGRNSLCLLSKCATAYHDHKVKLASDSDYSINQTEEGVRNTVFSCNAVNGQAWLQGKMRGS